jgi:hypothetical protein
LLPSRSQSQKDKLLLYCVENSDLFVDGKYFGVPYLSNPLHGKEMNKFPVD